MSSGLGFSRFQIIPQSRRRARYHLDSKADLELTRKQVTINHTSPNEGSSIWK